MTAPANRVSGRLVLALALLFAVVVSHPPAASASDVGYVGPSFAGANAPTGQKPQSKLWVADGIWWGSLFNPATTDFEIFRYDPGAHTWTTTTSLVDERSSAYMDTLWDGSHLYVATAGTSASTSSHGARIVRFAYDPATETWQRDAGFPVTITNGGVKSIVLARDSVGTLWVTWTAGTKVWIAHSTTDDATWSEPFVLPVPEATGIGPDEIAAVVAFDGDHVGVMWSDQVRNTMWFASHADGAPDTEWSVVAAYARPKGADDHINLHSLQSDTAGRVFAVVKTSLTEPTDPLIHVLVLGVDGTWSSHLFGRYQDQHTRAVLAIDATNRNLYVFASAPCCSGGIIYEKHAPLDNLQFEPGLGTPFISSSANPKINNPTTTKQLVDPSTGIVVLASDDSTDRYLFNSVDLSLSTRRVLSDDFSAGLGRWDEVNVSGAASATTENGELHLRSVDVARSWAYLRKAFLSRPAIAAALNVRYTATGDTGSVAFLRLLDGQGNRLVTLQRRASSARLQIAYGATTANTSALVPLGASQRIELRVQQRADGATQLQVLVNDAFVYNTSASLPAAPTQLQVGDDASRQVYDLYADNVTLDTGAVL